MKYAADLFLFNAHIAQFLKNIFMIRKVTADYIFPIAQAAIPKGVVVFDEATGKILEVGERANYNESELEFHKGAIVPGFVNAHCHLELSHMLGRVATGTGLISFIKQVVQGRGLSQEVIDAAIAAADEYMYNNGIVAVGDISNVSDTFKTKAQSKLRYYTFLENFDFWQEANTDAEFNKYLSVFNQLETPAHHAKSLVPHAPYSVSPRMFELINAENKAQFPNREHTISIHNQETPPENQLFEDKTKSEFVPFVNAFGFHYDALKSDGRTAIHYALENMPKGERWLFVHNTLTTTEDIKAAHAANPNKVYWASCPNANLYIENRLPKYDNFIAENAVVCLGTDSLTSNWQLSILEEMKTIARYQSTVPTETLLRWATLNGAQALGFDDTLGTIEAGKTCGLNLIDLDETLKFKPSTTVKRLV